MKVLHISTGLAGAGLCAERIHRSLLDEGIESRMLVFYPPKYKDDTVCSLFSTNSCLNYLIRGVRKVFRTIHLPIFEEDKFVMDGKKYKAYYSSPQTNLDISSHPWVQWADVIHLHWCNNFFDQPKFFENVTQKPIVWTLHDENLFYGTAHYHDAVLKDDSLEKKYYSIKHEMVVNSDNLSVVFLSQYFVDNFSTNSMLRGKRIFKIHNAVDCSNFTIQNKQVAKEYLCLPKDKKLLLFVATDILDRHKGLRILSEAVSDLQDEMIVIAVGGNSKKCQFHNVWAVGKVYDEKQLALYYSAADAYVIPSYQEAFSQSCIEALSCGTPVIGFPTGVCVDCINESNGYLCKDFTKEELINGIKKVLSTNYIPSQIRNKVANRFDKSLIANKYKEVYKLLLNE